MKTVIIAIAACIYILGVQVPTVTINIPLNNALQSINANGFPEKELREARNNFELRWNRWNVFQNGF